MRAEEHQKIVNITNDVSMTFTGHYKTRPSTKHKYQKNALNITGETEDCQKNWLQQINIAKRY
jgi:hypothetical protein